MRIRYPIDRLQEDGQFLLRKDLVEMAADTILLSVRTGQQVL